MAMSNFTEILNLCKIWHALTPHLSQQKFHPPSHFPTRPLACSCSLTHHLTFPPARLPAHVHSSTISFLTCPLACSCSLTHHLIFLRTYPMLSWLKWVMLRLLKARQGKRGERWKNGNEKGRWRKWRRGEGRGRRFEMKWSGDGKG